METMSERENLSTAPQGPRLISTNTYKGHTFQAFMHDADAFSFRVYMGESWNVEPGPLTESAPEFKSTQRAEMAAERWINDLLICGAPVDVGGWRITLYPEHKGTFGAVVESIDGPAPAPVEFVGYLKRDQAQDEAMTWAAHNPRGLSAPAVVEEPKADPDVDADLFAAAEPIDVTPPTAPATSTALAASEPTIPMAPAPTPSGARQVSAVDLEEHALLADEYTQLCVECLDLDNQIKELKSELKAKQVRLGNLAGKMSKGLLALRDGRSAGPFQTRLPMPETTQAPPFGTTPAAGEAAQLAADRLKPRTETWAFNGVEHVIEVRELEPNRWRAFLRGREADTEGFGESRDQALEATRNIAAIVFSDCDPGSTTSSSDAVPVADGPAPKARRSRKPKLKLKGKTGDEVVAALRSAMTLGEAATSLGCTEAELEDYARRADLKLSEHLGRDIGEDETPRVRSSKKAPTNKPSTKEANLAKIAGRGKRGRK
jgi:hypothetical protein